VTIGLSLPLGYLSGADDSADARCLAGAFGPPRDCLAELKDSGITSIELQGFGPDAPPAMFQDALARILDSGMNLTLHGYLSSETAGRLSCGICPQLLSAVGSFENRQDDIVVTVHALGGHEADYLTMVKGTTRALERLADDIRTRDIPVRICLEINRYHGFESPGATYDGLLEIARTLDGATVGFCWDMGHTSSSVLQKRLASRPPDEFIARVLHTHLHDISPEGDTHWPLTEDCPHLASGIRHLENCGYTGAYNLELYPTRWSAQRDVKDGILRSILCLRKIRDHIRSRR